MGGVYGDSKKEDSIVLDVNMQAEMYTLAAGEVVQKTISTMHDEMAAGAPPLTPKILRATIETWLGVLVKHGAFSDFEGSQNLLSSFSRGEGQTGTSFDAGRTQNVVLFPGCPAPGCDRR